MDKKELLEKLRFINEELAEDEEVCHVQADQALLDYINDLEVMEAFYKIDKWYA